MSCHLLPFSHIGEIKAVRDFLFPPLKDLPCSTSASNFEDEKTSDGNDWDTDWGDWNETMEDEEREIEPMEEQTDSGDDNGHKWLQDSIVSVSPAADLIAIANDNKMVLLAPKYSSESLDGENETSYTIAWSGSVSETETVTALLCLPLASQKRSTQGAPDWCCVIVGFSSGYVRMYTETGTLLLSQKLHTEKVQRLKCNTYIPPRYLGIAEQHEELVILYVKCLVTIDGFSLFQALKACRNQVARATASGETGLQPPPLAYKKWAPQEIDTIKDCHTTGVHTPNPFDQMALASLSSHTASVRPSPPAGSMYLTAGVAPYVGFFFAIEGSSQPILSEVAYAVASKLKSAIMSATSGWLSFGGKPKSEEVERQPKIEPSTPLPLRFGLPDHRREGISVSLSPNNKYAATTDSFGRVMLIDVDRGIAVRMWKGYRDAQVGWLDVREDEGQHTGRSKQSRTAQFLVIYAARRGLLEVWLAGSGPRVAAFNVSKFCQLLHISYGILGLNNVTCKGVKIKAFQVALMDVDGSIKTVEVPFHLALSDKNNKRVRDMHLLKKLKLALKENHEESEALEDQMKDLLLNIRIANIAQQGVERILDTKYLSPRFQKTILQSCIHKLQQLGEVNLDIERKLFLQYCKIQKRLINTYNKIDSLKGDKSVTDMDTEVLSKLLGLSEAEVEHVISQVERSRKMMMTGKHPVRVRFDADSETHVSSFLDCFTCNVHVSEQDNQTGASAISLVKDLPDEKRLQLGTFVYDRCLKHHCSADDLGTVLIDSGINIEDLGHLLVWTWLNESNQAVNSMASFFNLLKIITSNIGKSRLQSDPGGISPWYQSLIDLCQQSTHCQAAYLAAVVTKCVAMDTTGSSHRATGLDATAKDPDADIMSCSSEAGSPLSSPVSEGVINRPETEAFNRLVKRTEDLVALDCLLKLSPDRYKKRTDCEPVTVCVASLLEGGKGCITEVVARHVAHSGFKPEDLYQPVSEETSNQTAQDSGTTADSRVPGSNKERIWEQMTLLRKRFPHSLEIDVLFSNSCWEYTVQWNKQPEDVESLGCALEFLKLVQNALLRQGVASMMWHMFLLKRFQAAALLMEKVGKVPKDRLSRKEVGISEHEFPQFISCICDFFTIIMEANCESNEVPVFNLEPLWSEVKGTVSLVELAIDQKTTNYMLLKHHHHLAVLMEAVVEFSLKSVKVMSLFDSKGRNAFFQEFHSHPYIPNQNTDMTIAIVQKQFITRVITQSVMKLRESTTTAEQTSVSLSRLKSYEACQWPARLIEIAQDFGLDIDLLKRHQVCELYSAGFDRLAEEVLVTVNDHESLGTQLLAIVGQRMSYYLNNKSSHAVVKLMANVNPALATWLKSMNSKLLLQPDCPVSDLKALVSHAMNQLPEGHAEYELAVALVELVQSLS